MDKKKKAVLMLVLLAVLLGGSGILYTKLGETVKPDQIEMQTELNTKQETEQKTDQETEQKMEQDTEQKSEQDTEQQVMKAPDFTVYDIDGKEVHLSDYIGKPVVLNFWASWCGPCKMEIPDFEEAYKKQGDTVQFLLVNMTDGARETIDTASEYIESQGYTLPVCYDTQSDAAQTYGVSSIPVTYFIDAQGGAIAQAVGAIDGDTLQKGIDMVNNK